jgi:hypothetical protein
LSAAHDQIETLRDVPHDTKKIVQAVQHRVGEIAGSSFWAPL